MKAWMRAPTYRSWWCGNCGAEIPSQAPLLVIQIGRARLVRGGCCEPAPPDLPAVIETTRDDLPARLQRLANVLPFDKP